MSATKVKKEEAESEELLFMSDFGPISKAKLHEVRLAVASLVAAALRRASPSSL